MSDTNHSQSITQGTSTIPYPFQWECRETDKYNYYTEHSKDRLSCERDTSESSALGRARKGLNLLTSPHPDYLKDSTETAMVFSEITLSNEQTRVTDDPLERTLLNMTRYFIWDKTPILHTDDCSWPGCKGWMGTEPKLPKTLEDGTIEGEDPGAFVEDPFNFFRICNKDGGLSDCLITLDQLKSEHSDVYRDILTRWDGSKDSRVDSRLHVLRPFKESFHLRGWPRKTVGDVNKTVWYIKKNLDFPPMSTSTARWFAGSHAGVESSNDQVREFWSVHGRVPDHEADD
ncbi:uncharacterized protein L199_008624 [Kwoniella botswanensis]|uniref:uncharacterized protein n=1 Tax=Kwoniella botswanensis TaxID=1268659 RepID=UPI00315C9EF9